MPRIARAVAEGFPHHIVQRGNNREDVFFTDEDRAQYLKLLRKYTTRWDVSVLAYCLMSNHVHLLARPEREESLAKMMQGVTLCYTQYVNRTHGRSGRLWESRYHSCIVDRETYLWAVARYVEQNPKRARLVRRAEDYAYSSARAHILGGKDSTLGEELFDEKQRADYREVIREDISDGEYARIRYATKTGRPFGGEKFLRKMEKKMERVFILKRPGRPKNPKYAK
jgi:putative transposase